MTTTDPKYLQCSETFNPTLCSCETHIDTRHSRLCPVHWRDTMTTTRSTDEPPSPPHGPCGDTCDQCTACMVQGVYCHETGCRNTPIGKCDQCGDEITTGGGAWTNSESVWTGLKFCNRYCAEQAAYQQTIPEDSEDSA